mmetsp:Transcript_72642/g.122265  ORF Transcript_72642/g.122265 Transcript_72642/m.122265 type:complete len:310 (-) Transcript_72642:43-972(-)
MREEQSSAQEAMGLAARQPLHAGHELRSDGITSKVLDELVIVHNPSNFPRGDLCAASGGIRSASGVRIGGNAVSSLGLLLGHDVALGLLRLAELLHQGHAFVHRLLQRLPAHQALNIKHYIFGVHSDGSGCPRFRVPLPTQDIARPIIKANLTLFRRAGVVPHQRLERLVSAGLPELHVAADLREVVEPDGAQVGQLRQVGDRHRRRDEGDLVPLTFLHAPHHRGHVGLHLLAAPLDTHLGVHLEPLLDVFTALDRHTRVVGQGGDFVAEELVQLLVLGRILDPFGNDHAAAVGRLLLKNDAVDGEAHQ